MRPRGLLWGWAQREPSPTPEPGAQFQRPEVALAKGHPLPGRRGALVTSARSITRTASVWPLGSRSRGAPQPSAPGLGPPAPAPRARDPASRSHDPPAAPPAPHSPSCGAASLPLLPPDGSRAAPSRASAPAGRAASRPAAATSSRSRRWLTVKFLRAWAQSPGPSAGGGGGGPGPSAGLSRAKAAAALSMPASRRGVAGRVAGGVAASAPRRRALCPALGVSRPRGRPARLAPTSGKPTFLPPLCLLALSQVANTRAAPATRPFLKQTSPRPLLLLLLPAPPAAGREGVLPESHGGLGAGRGARRRGVALPTHIFRSGKLQCFDSFKAPDKCPGRR